MLEKTVEAYLVERVRALGGTAYKFTSPARASVPDRIVILPPGRIFFVELKRPGGKLTRGQEREHEHLRRLGADVRMLDSIGAINTFLNEVQAVAADGETQRVADGLEACDWSGVPIGCKAIIKHAISLLRAALAGTVTQTESKCTRCGSSTAQACNELGCFYLESGEGEPAKIDENTPFEMWASSQGLNPRVFGSRTSPSGAYGWARAGYERGFRDGQKSAAPADAALSNRVSQLEKALVYVGHRLHDTPQYMLCDGVELIDNDGIKVKARGIDVAVSLRGNPQPVRSAAPAEAREPVATLHDDGHYVWNPKVPKPEGYDRAGWKMAVYGVPADAGEVVAPVVAALRKLVHLKSLKDGADRCVPGYIEDRIEYQRDKPKAWDDARAALASFDAAQGAQGGKGGEA
ncbi:VRR-NUC domain-containing protein [Burkholderia gladioli]|uniref:VRR-NUC domain-containing protein n=1 Tax=Burkholderia gladioli TaxID=28095 RepID=UPI001ABAE1EB|nr:VRR-NUC domain-containing protein [Burkholderia gladioli]